MKATSPRSVTLLKAAPVPDQLADRLDGGDWRGIEIALMPADVADDDAIDRAVQTVSDVGVHLHQLSITAEAPVAWPSGAFVRVDRLADQARSGIEASVEYAAPVGARVHTAGLS